MGAMKRAIERERQEFQLNGKQERFASTIVIAAAIVAAVRLASTASPRVALDTLLKLEIASDQEDEIGLAELKREIVLAIAELEASKGELKLQPVGCHDVASDANRP
jgi:hypothetical protein